MLNHMLQAISSILTHLPESLAVRSPSGYTWSTWLSNMPTFRVPTFLTVLRHSFLSFFLDATSRTHLRRIPDTRLFFLHSLFSLIFTVPFGFLPEIGQFLPLFPTPATYNVTGNHPTFISPLQFFCDNVVMIHTQSRCLS